MKRRITLSIALVLSIVLVSLMSSDSTTNAQPPQRFRFRTGVITPGNGQLLRITLGCGGGNYCPDAARVRILWTQYVPGICMATPLLVCRQTVDSQGATPVITLGNDALSFDVPGNGNGVNVVVESNSRNVRVNAFTIDITSGRVDAFFDVFAEE